jgi:hypothetical protein
MMGFRLGASFCRNTFKNGGVCIFVCETIYSTNMSVEKYCMEKDLEVCAVMLHLPAHKICVIAIYRAPSGNFQYFFQNLDKLLNMIFAYTGDIIICGDINDKLLNMIFAYTGDIIICGDININYLNDSSHKQQLDYLLASHGLYSIMQFLTRNQIIPIQ